MASVALTVGAVADLDDLISTRGLGDGARPAVRRRLAQLELFPESGARLEGRWAPARVLVGPWSWMLLVYDYDEATDRVLILSVADARTSSAPGNR